jgi:hypothetical protein
MAYKITIENNGSEVASLNVSDTDITFLKHKLLDADVGNWIVHAATFFVTKKIAACRDAVIETGIIEVEADTTVTSLPKDKVALANLIMTRPSYKNRQSIQDEQGSPKI